MGVYTSLDIVASDHQWTPDRQFIERLFAFLGATAVSSITGYSAPLYWDSDDIYDQEVFGYRHWSLEQALNQWEATPAVAVFMAIECPDWGDKLYGSISSFPESMTDGYQPADTSLCIGPLSIPDLWMERTVGYYNFDLTLSGYGSPGDARQYMECLRDATPIKELIAFLRERSGEEWEMHMSVSY